MSGADLEKLMYCPASCRASTSDGVDAERSRDESRVHEQPVAWMAGTSPAMTEGVCA
ncbi:MAG: hypothetical protein JWM77_3332 [Rhodospirillales bacterium]|jgi:hypothetical protein|nr:hypothetical protein [Rhodospirillales bacterium]